ncbi:histidine triad nucleotide-binding protein [Prosthecochloris sp. ZM_2]|uniref:histidine triad nucleotide-binding protein n=1 Tax=Prosthecochloris sp. ZM_2 TaxID=2045206 RepID=UPI000DF735FA|nr:histidine triad nucleotide-binding protein [Prosthecochloris sp. ZM_2]RNA65643.1 histidine triad nucleotide-binding protein [Prosthecochloris sp. ZM_2]
MPFHDPDCLFCKIAAGEVPADIVYSDDHVVAFRDIQPVADAHILIIPRKHIASLSHLEEGDLDIAGHILSAAGKTAEKAGIAASGYRLVFNTGPDALQSVFHIHGHLIGGQKMGWPPFPGTRVQHG